MTHLLGRSNRGFLKALCGHVVWRMRDDIVVKDPDDVSCVRCLIKAGLSAAEALEWAEHVKADTVARVLGVP